MGQPGDGRVTVDIAEVLKRAKPPERFVDVCLNANLKAEHADLDRQMQDVAAAIEAGDGDEDRRRTLADQLHDLEGQMRADTVRFHIRGMSAYQRDEWLDAHPRRDGKQEGFNPVTGEPALVAVCCVDPAMTVEQATDLRRTLAGDWDRLIAAAWEASTEGSSIPFSLLASVARRQPSGK
jgi:hypothetical protein